MPKPARFSLGMQGDLLETVVENPNRSSIPTCPELLANVFRRNLVIRPGYFHMAVAMHTAAGLLKGGEQSVRQGQKGATFRFKTMSHLLACGPVNPLVGNLLFPRQQPGVLFGQG